MHAELSTGTTPVWWLVGVEVGGCWCDEAVTFLDHLASAQKEALPSFGAARFFMWRRRWSRMLMLAVASGRAFAQSLVSAE